MEVNTKFNIGDQFWMVDENKVVLRIVTGLVINLEGDTTEIKYSTWGNDKIPEHLMYKTKNELLESL